MKIQNSMMEKLQKELSPKHLQVVNESSQHHRDPSGETHFSLLIVSERFAGLGRIDRQRLIQGLFNEERQMGLHALTMKTFTADEWDKVKDTFQMESPTCLSGSGH
jgi:stress-induced morphogen